MYNWHKSFVETLCICANKKNSSRRRSDETVEGVRASFLCSQWKSTRRASRELDDVCHMTVLKMIRKQLSFRMYKFQLLQELKALIDDVGETFVLI
jgi:hypothetical protein